MNKKRRLADLFANIWMRGGIYILLLIPIFISVGLYWKAAPLFERHSIITLIFSEKWLPMKGEFGFLAFIYSSLYVTILSFILSAPLCLFAGIYLTQFGKPRLLNFMLPVIDILAGIPSVVYGVWGVLVIVPFISGHIAPFFGSNSTGYSLLAGGIV